MTDSSNIAALLQELTGRTHITAKDNIYNCPMHKARIRTLHANPNEHVPGGWELFCTHPTCGFHGGVIEFTAKVQDTILGNAMRMFWPKGPMHGVFFEADDPDKDKEALQCLLVSREKQLSMKDWLEKARLKFMNHARGRGYLVDRGIREDMFHRLKPAVCCPQMPDDIILQVKKMVWEQTMVFPYYNGGDIAFLAFEDMDLGKRRYVLPSMKDIPGMFMPAPLPVNANRLIVAQTETDAMLLYLKSEEIGTQDFYPVCVSEVKGLDVAFNATEVILVSHAGRPLELKDTIRYAEYRLPVKVMDIPVALRDMDSARLKSLSDKAKTLRTWHMDTIVAHFDRNGGEATAKMLSASGMPKTEKSELVNMMLTAHSTNDVLMDIIRKSEPLHMIKSVGKTTVKRTINGYFQLLPVEKQLSNFMIQADSIVGTDKDKNQFVSGRLIAPGVEQEITIPVSIMATTSVLKAYLRRCLVSKGNQEHLQLFMDKPNGSMDWYDLITTYDKPKSASERAFLGISAEYIAYPEARIRLPDGKISEDFVPEALKNRFCGMYEGIKAGHTGLWSDVIPNLLASDNGGIVVFREILSHLLYETALASIKPDVYVPNHIIVPYRTMEFGACLTVESLAAMLSGPGKMKVLGNENDTKAFIAETRNLNRLPVIFAARDPIKLVTALLQFKSASVVLHPINYCSRYMGSNTTWFMGTVEDETVAPEVIEAVKLAWPSMLITARNLLIEHGCGEPRASLPSSRLLELFAHKAGMIYRDPQLFTKRYTPEAISTEQLFRVIRFLTDQGKLIIAPGRYAYYKTDDYLDAVGFVAVELNRLVLLPQKLLSVVSTVSRGVDLTELQQHMRNKFGITEHGARGEIIINPDDWAAAITEPPMIRAVTAESLGLTKIEVS